MQKNIIIRDGINSLRLTGSVKNGLVCCMYPGTKFNLPPYFNANFFIILRAYAEIATDDGASCWAQWSSWLSIYIWIIELDKKYVTLVKGFAGSEEKTSSKLQTGFARQHRAVNT